METLKEDKVHFYNLDVLRFLAALSVAVFHGWNAYCGWFRIPGPLATPDGKTWSATGNVINTFAGNLDLGVEFFFLISGFLITYLLIKEKELSGTIKIGKFYLRRALRIWPLYFFVIAVSPFWFDYTQQKLPDYKWLLTFTANFEVIVKREWVSPLGHFWSIAIEEHFYLVWPLLLLVVTNKKLPALFTSVIVMSLLFRIFSGCYLQEWVNHINLNTLARVDAMAIGGFVAWMHHRRPFVINIPAYLRVLVYSLAVFLLCTESSHNMPGLFYMAIKKYIYILFMLFWLLNYLFNPHAVLSFKKKNFLHYLGKISFGIYVYHNILFNFIVQKLMYKYGISSFYLFWLIYLALVFILSALSFELLEKPILRLKDRFAVIKTAR